MAKRGLQATPATPLRLLVTTDLGQVVGAASQAHIYST
jgi:hypothetical protein